MDEEQAYKASGWVASMITVITSIWFIIEYLRIREKSSGFTMVLILAIGDFLSATTTIIRLILTELQISDNYLYPVNVGSSRFALFWSAAIGIFTYLILVKRKTFDGKKFIRNGTILCLIAALAILLMIETKFCGLTIKNVGPGNSVVEFTNDNTFLKILGMIIYHLGGTLVPIVVIFYSYWKIYRELIKDNLLTGPQTKPNRILLFIVFPISCFIPWLFTEMFASIFTDQYPFLPGIIFNTLRRCWGFLNLLAFWILNPLREEGDASVPLSSNSGEASRQDY